MKQQKTSLVTSVLDELATVGYLTCNEDKKQSLKLIREILKDYDLPIKSSKVDTTIKTMQSLANANNCDINNQLFGLANLGEKALTELYR